VRAWHFVVAAALVLLIVLFAAPALFVAPSATDTNRDIPPSSITETTATASRSATSVGQSAPAGSGGATPAHDADTGLDSASEPKAPLSITFSVECKTLAKENPEAAARYANGGIIYPITALTLPAGATVADALDATGLSYEGAYGYLKDIVGLAEKSFGDQSAWFYTVNGTFPESSFNTCQLKDGDQVIWRYSMDSGYDIQARIH
jgi:hypothetical protein